MIDWAARARAHFAQGECGVTAKTDRTQVVSVSSAGGTDPKGKALRVSSVLSVATRTYLDNVVGTKSVNGSAGAAARRSGNPYLTPDQGDECHAGGWDDREIETFVARALRFTAMGRTDADHLAERLTLRDRQGDSLRLCVECRELMRSGKCGVVSRGATTGVDRRPELAPDDLMPCHWFAPAMTTIPSIQESEDESPID